MKCMNEKCNKDPSDSLSAKVVSIDGDFVCDATCEAAYREQYNHFMNVTIQSEQAFNDWMKS